MIKIKLKAGVHMYVLPLYEQCAFSLIVNDTKKTSYYIYEI